MRHNENKGVTNNELFKEYLKIYKNSTYNTDELEILFGINKRINKINFDNTISKIKSLGFKCKNEMGDFTLKISTLYNDERTGNVKQSNIRTEINHLSSIKNYCNNERFNIDDIPPNINFLQKSYKKKDNDETLYGIVYKEYNLKINYKIERNKYKSDRDNKVNDMLDKWSELKKTFRYIKRFTYIHDDLPFKIDFSIVRTSKKVWDNIKKRNKYVYEYSIKNSNIFNNPINYEIELELIKNKCDGYDIDRLMQLIKRGMTYILSGLQFTNYPIAYTGNNSIKYIQNEYLRLINNDRDMDRDIDNKDFIGPSSISLEMSNIIRNKENMGNIPNINHEYCVTEKADGLRKLLYISKDGLIYLIDHNMNIQYTGCRTRHHNNYGTIIDGEHVMYDKHGNYINNYLCFDIYFMGKKDIRHLPFLKNNNNDGRYDYLIDYIKALDIEYISKSNTKYFIINIKKFYSNMGQNDIYEQCKKIINNINNDLYDYNTDGLVFTPINKSVGCDKLVKHVKSRKVTWKWSLKWKPPNHNTIDFLITTKKDKNGMDWVGNMFESGVNNKHNKSIKQYKNITLRVGYSIKRHGYLNPCGDIYDDKIYNDIDNDNDIENDYRPAPFIPYEPTPDYDIFSCNIPLVNKGNEMHMTLENSDEVFNDETIVEFRYEPKNDKHWRFIPIKVRYDKTEDYLSNNKVYGNDFRTALSVWKSINNPITEHMITTGVNIPDNIDNEDIYYNKKTGYNTTQSLRDFHNRYVKRQLIHNISKPGDTLIDMTVGKAGDLYKWVDARLSFILGIDLSKDNIENRKDGACVRYLNMRKKYNNSFDAIFLTGNSSKNILNTNAFSDDRTKMVARALYGMGNKDPKILGNGVYRLYGKAKNGFDIISNQFSTHYFFKDIDTLKNFIINLCENCKLNGYFIGTCYDGKRVFKLLETYEQGDSLKLTEHNNVKWEIKKLYNNDELQNNSNSLGMSIDIYQESINKTITEYLVNFDYFIRVMENYGFIPAPLIDIEKHGFNSAIGSFQDLYDKMEHELSIKKLWYKNIKNANKMSKNDKLISFLNNYFIFKKVRNVDCKKVQININEKFSIVRNIVKFKRRIKII